MGFWSRIFGESAAPVAPVRVEPRLAETSPAPSMASESGVHHPEQWLLTSFGGGPSAAGVRVSAETALNLPAVVSCVRILSTVFAIAPLVYYRRLDGRHREPAVDNPLYRLFHDRPNDVNSPFSFKEMVLQDILLDGNHFSFTPRDFRSRPKHLTRLEPGKVQVLQHFDRERGVAKYFDATLPDGSGGRFSSGEVWHIPGFTRSGLMGLNPMRFMREALGAALATQDYASRFFSNDAKPATVLASELKIDKSDKAQIRTDWDTIHRGSANAHRTAILDQGLKPEFLTHDNKASQFLETRTFQVVDIARAFGVPPHLVFELSKATFSNIEHQSLEFILYFMQPHFERVAGAANLAFAEPDHFFEFNTAALIKGDIKSRFEAYNLARNMGVLNANDIRAAENRNPIPGKAGSEYWRPANMAPSGEPDPAPVSLPDGQEESDNE